VLSIEDMPLARVLVVVLALAHAVGLADLVLDDEVGCTDDGCGDCLPDAACRCHCPSAMPMVESRPVQVASCATSPEAYVPFVAVERMHASPDPREILHVPRLGA
jgi:hypothetical protein